MNYRRNFLTQVLCRLEYAERISALVSPEKSEFTNLIAERYPIAKDQQQVSFSMQVDVQKGTAPAYEQSVVGRQWLHSRTPESTTIAVLDPAYFSLEYQAGGFTTFTDMKTELAYLFGALARCFPNLLFSRAGLRYINEITLNEGSPLDWEGLIDDDLLDSVFASVPEPETLVRSMHQVTSRKDDVFGMFNYGIHNPDFPNVVARRQFILDIDCSRPGAFRHDEVMAQLDALNLRCEEMFEGSIANGLREKMEVIRA